MRGIKKQNAKSKMNQNAEEDRFESINLPQKWGLVSSLSFILELAEDSGLCEKFWQKARPALDFLNHQLGLNDIQLIFLAVMIEEGENMTWRSFGMFLGLSRLQTMIYADDIEELIEKGWVVRSKVREIGGMKEGFRLEKGVVNAIRHEKPYIPEDLSGITLQEFLDRITTHFDTFLRERNYNVEDYLDWFRRIINANPELEICRILKTFENEYDAVLLLLFIANYSLFADSGEEGVGITLINRVFPDEIETDGLRFKIRDGSHFLFQKNFIEYKNEDGIANFDVYALKSNVKENLLSEFKPCNFLSKRRKASDPFLQSHEKIQAKNLFYNPSEEAQIKQLSKLIDKDNFPKVQHRLSEKGMRKGFACLFYGAPGTGKTETVLQLARLSKRDIIKVEVAGLRDKFVGESENNIKNIFSRYRELCKDCENLPILLFNEADAIFGKRFDSPEQSVDKMNNAMQNIILQEMEDLEGIMIATTNLTDSFDSAFERRFIFKIEFKKPEVAVKKQIWKALLGKDISNKDALSLAKEYDFSGGQIENIMRKQTINYIINGKRPTINSLRHYCNEEVLNLKSHKSVGFKF